MTNAPSARFLDATVGNVAAADLHACELFDRVGFSFAEDSELSIRDACRRHGIDETMVLAELELAGACPVAPRSFDALAESCSEIVRFHHGPLRASLGAIRTSLSALEAQTGDAAVRELRRGVERLAEHLLMHFAKEENILFPALAALAGARQRNERCPRLPFPSVMHPIRVMEVEHQRIAHELDALAAMDNGEAVRQCRTDLASFTRLLTAHARFENELLFARALELERMLL